MGSKNQNYRVVVIDSLGGMAQIVQAWNDLLVKSRSSTIFLTWEWVYIWSKCFLGTNRRLFVLVVYLGEELVAIAPWSIRDIKRWGISLKLLEFLGTPEMGSDYLDVFTKPGEEKKVAQCIYQFLFQDAAERWDSIVLSDISSDSRFLLYYLQLLEEEGKHVELECASFCPVVTLPGSRQEFLSQLSPNRRQQYLRHPRLTEKKGKVIHQTFRGLDAERSLENFKNLYQERWKASEKEILFLQELVSSCSRNDWIQIDLLEVDGKQIAGLLHFRHQNSLSMFLMAVDHGFDKSISIGNVLVGLSIEKAILNGIKTYDFLKGTEDYKFHWANGGRRSLRLHFYSQKAGPLIWMTGRFMKSVAKVLVR